MTLLAAPEIRTEPNRLSGKAIAEHLLGSGEIPPDTVQEPVADMDEVEKKLLNERLRAERFGIQGAIIDRFAASAVIEDPATGRPALNFEVTPRPLENRGWLSECGYLDDGPDGPGRYEFWQPASAPPNLISDFQEDFGVSLDQNSAAWGTVQLARGGDPEVSRWAHRLVVVGQQQKDLDVVEAIIGDQEDVRLHLKGGNDAPDTPLAAIEQLPMSNISEICGELAKVALECLDDMGIIDEDERLQVLDDIVLQTRDISQHHIARHFNGTLGEVDDATRLRELGATLDKDNDGRWYLDWEGRVKQKPKDKIFSRTQHCPAAYRMEDEPSAIERLGWAFNTELQRRGFLKPGATHIPAPSYDFPPPVRISIDPWDRL